jgi:outer membrane protein
MLPLTALLLPTLLQVGPLPAAPPGPPAPAETVATPTTTPTPTPTTITTTTDRERTPPAGPPAVGRAPHARQVSLPEALSTGAKKQPALRQARAETAAASARTEQARSGLLPQVTATGQYQRTTGNFAPRPGAVTTGAVKGRTVSFDTYNFFTFGVTATQLLYDFGQTTDRGSAARASLDATRTLERSAEVNVAYEIRSAYLLALAQKNLLAIADETLANERRHLAQVEGYVTGGTRPSIDLAQSRTTVANAKYQVISAENAYESAKALLNQAMGVVGDTDFDVTGEKSAPVDGEDATTARLSTVALDQRADLTSLRQQRDASLSTVRSLKGAYGPTIAAQASATENGLTLAGLVPNFAVGVTVTWPLFQGYSTRGQIHEAEATIARVDAQFDATSQQVRAEVEQARLGVRSGKAGVVAAEEALAAARERLRLAEGRYAQGIGSIIELSDAQVAVTNAGAQIIAAELTVATARAALLRALGRP